MTNDPDICTILTNDPDMCTILTKDPEICTILTNDPDICTILTNDPEICTILTNDLEICTSLTNDPEICTILIFFRKGSGKSFSTTFCVWLFKKSVSQFILLTDQILLSGCLYFLKYWTCVLRLFVSNVVTS